MAECRPNLTTLVVTKDGFEIMTLKEGDTFIKPWSYSLPANFICRSGALVARHKLHQVTWAMPTIELEP